MVIETIDKTYEVIGYAKSDEAAKRYICREASDGQEYMLLCIIDRQQIGRLLPFFFSKETDGAFRDYHGCFVADSCLHLVFSYHDGQSLRERLELSNCTLEERMDIFGKLLEKLMLVAMPDGVAANVLGTDSILVSDANDVNFRYELPNLEAVLRNDGTDVQKRLLKIYDVLFADELKRRTVLALTDYRDIIRPGDYDSIFEAYRLFKVFSGIVDELPREDREIPHTKGYLLWERVKSVFPIIKRIVLMVIALCAVGFLVWSFWNTMRSEKKEIVFDQIGTYEIKKELEGQ